MTTNLSYGLPADFGSGPMALGNEYRWNLPVLTYGFDQSFLNHFGERGVRAVEDAIATLNDLPPASEMDLTTFSHDTRFANFEAQALGLVDLKSLTLSLLLRELGLAEPERYAWSLRERTAAATRTNYIVVQRNYDPTTVAPSAFVNGAEYTYQIVESNTSSVADAVEVTIDPLEQGFNAVAGMPATTGEFVAGLTRDDAGGLRYLYHPTNVNVEALAPGVTAVEGTLVDVASRPGIDKVTFVRLGWNTNQGAFIGYTNIFTDTYMSNGVPVSSACGASFHGLTSCLARGSLAVSPMFLPGTITLSRRASTPSPGRRRGVITAS